MPQPQISDQVKQRLIDALKKHGGRRKPVADEFGWSPTTLSSRLCAMKMDPKWAKKIPAVSSTVSLMGLPGPSVSAERDQRRIRFLEAKVERMRAVKRRPAKAAKKRSGKDDELWVAIPDLHGSQQDRAAVAAFLSDLKRIGPSRVIDLGDLTDCSGFLAAHHVLGHVAETEYTWEQDTADAAAFLDGVRDAVGDVPIEVVEGNHDQRPEKLAITMALRNPTDSKFLRKMVCTEEVLQLKKRDVVYHRRGEAHDGLPIQGAIRRGRIIFTHGLQRGGGSGVTACARMIDRFGGNVAFAHTHWLSQLVRRSVSHGTIGAWNCGHLSRQAPLWMHGDPTNWTTGYAVFVVARSGAFLPLLIPIIDGQSLLPTLKLG